MSTILNTSNINNDNGRITFSGASSGIDWQASVDAIMAAKRIPADNIETKISANNDKISALNELKTLTLALANSLDKLRGGNQYATNDIFRSKVAYTQSAVAASAAPGHTASAASSLLSVAVTDKAQSGSHTVEVLQLAQSHQLRSDAVSSKTTDFTTLGFATGTITINGKNIDISGSDTLISVRDKINSLNTGTDAIGVSASIVSVSDTEHYLVLNAEETGFDNQITFGGDQAVHNALGFTTAGTNTVKNESRAAQNAQIRVDGLATVVERNSNTINDVLEGVTIDLLQAEEGTEVEIVVGSNYQSVKDTIVDFMEAYNNLRAFVTDQRTEQVRVEGEEATRGVLAFDPVLRRVTDELGSIVTMFQDSNTDGYRSLGQVGISMASDYTLTMDDSVFDTKLLGDLSAMRNLFSFQVSTSDARVVYFDHDNQSVNHTDGNGSNLPFYINIGGTDANGNVISATIAEAPGAGSVTNGSLEINGNKITVKAPSDAAGITFLVLGNNLGPIEDVTMTYTRGAADGLYQLFNEINDAEGVIEVTAQGLQSSNEQYEQNISRIEERLEVVKQNLTDRFLAMETALAQLENLKKQMEQQFEALTGNSNN